METIQTILILLFLIVLSSIFHKCIPSISLPLFQITLGVLAGILPFGISFHLDTEVFMLLFIAPILFMDGRQISNRELWNFRKPILLMALGLVFSTILICGPIITLLIPGLPLAAAFALAAVISPTDAVAVKSISNKIKLPHNIITIVEGESLLNDASGLVAFNFAIMAQLTGTFSIKDVTLSFLYIAIGGALFGAIATYIINVFTEKLKAMGIEDATVYTLIQIITPFAVFLIAEELGLSGILAVVVCGIIISVNRPKRFTAQEANINFISEGAWSTLLFVLNGLVFLLLGIELSTAFNKEVMDTQISTFTDISYVLVISVLLILIRYIWAYFFIGKEQGKRMRNSLLISLSGVRGALTLAACLSIPLTLNNGSPFPRRDLILFISGGVIIVTLLIANIVLPVICPKTEADSRQLEADATKKVIQAAIDLIKSEMNDDNRQAAFSIIAHYERMLSENSNSRTLKFASVELRKEIEIFMTGLIAEKEEIKRLLETNTYKKEALLRIERTLDRVQSRLERRRSVKGLLSFFRHKPGLFLKRQKYLYQDDMVLAKRHTTQVAINAIWKTVTPENEIVAKRAIDHYMSILEVFNKRFLGEEGKVYADKKRQLQLSAIQTQKAKVQELLEFGEISYTTAGQLRKNIGLEEAALFEEDVS
ncbi:Na+/H+ antiporter [Lacrimispora sp.]|uniref:Na+/H+ antiporter n=1 Tax=Lacrimispora sp. TaxID=2719234 RepID=UPI0028AFC1EB|nr:Na+/H+ antiporter [Lacrimispora sp.]